MKQVLLIAAFFTTAFLTAQNYQYLGSYTSDGTPLYFVQSDVITQATLDLVHNSLPENYPVPTYNPQYISSGYDSDLIVDSLADVWVTFVSEGAGYKNVLGFYTYDLNNPPTTAPTASQITIVFPNVSAAGSGGSLVAGNKVKIGTFPAGTGIGWVLLANAWNGTQVTNGLWRLFSNPNFNPEANASLRQHNVLLNDPTNERIILGFEDIRRDNGSCDNDFNDAVFYISANPYTALRTTNVADVSTATVVTSANSGGLESEGSLATLIAKRNFNRVKNNSFQDKKQNQIPFEASTISFNKSTATTNFSALFPVTGMFGTETSYVSTPADLLAITNAQEIYSVDYYNGNDRVVAALATKTIGGIYNHSKVICDRLNNSSLEDVRTINLNGYEIIMVKLKRDNGVIEYALSFSVQQLTSENKLHSYWNIGQYPTGDYLNFQIWGATMGQVSSIANYILNRFIDQAPLTTEVVANRIPTVFVKKGNYKDGQITLSIINKSGATSLQFEGNKKATELSTTDFISSNNSISSAYQSDITLTTNGLFDIGFSIVGNNSPQQDALYLADGPWGIDYLATETNISSFQITNPTATATSNASTYVIERDASVSGNVKGTMNLFRNILPGELLFDATNYDAVRFSIQNTLPVEVIMVTENTTDWNNRLRFQIPANTDLSQFVISFQDFSSPNGAAFNNEKIRGFVFSVKGDYNQFQPFELNVNSLVLGTNSALNTSNFSANAISKTYNYPNPFETQTTIVLPEVASKATVKLIDITGRVLQESTDELNNGTEINFVNNNAPKGIYILSITTDTNKSYQQKCVIK
ncbi:DUF4114 domain-containing protein [Flavobacterium sp. SUN052]|uniref:DUF4114 domain-containing protein n=1 Tax=Flavobacterium sp. SUN052 TaxID=3002441 RepID=UPI00237E5355|nr:DUF4114 domain-containing protein [Flavobacterium sp. SUN052]MEC4003992.1 DUF4114 domain-containing protein [Flavobacterium sp. SUN052]